MTNESSRPNPYAPAGVIESESDDALHDINGDLTSDVRHRLPIWRIAIRWTFVCSLSAIPSFLFGMVVTKHQQIPAMLVGIAIFCALYTWLDWRTAQQAWRNKKSLKWTLGIMYGTRVLISIAVPIGGMLDIICGVVSTSLVTKMTGFEFEPGGPESEISTFGESFFPVLLTTLIQGGLMNVVLAIYGIVVFGIVLAIRAISGKNEPQREKTIAVDPSSLNS
ncbi:hypothetical protein [Novipirellula caenicola]|uniref:Uncharacterized protein n=1 Tax=Novipirellula caenicola TaxID=1536901 RepID=A0ABP9VP20_9BACT